MNRSAIRSKLRQEVVDLLDNYLYFWTEHGNTFTNQRYIRGCDDIVRDINKQRVKNPNYIPTAEDASEWDSTTHLDTDNLAPLELLPELIRKIKKADRVPMPYGRNFYHATAVGPHTNKDEVDAELDNFITYSHGLAHLFKEYAKNGADVVQAINEKRKRDPNYIPTLAEAKSWDSMSNIEELNPQPLEDLARMVDFLEK